VDDVEVQAIDLQPLEASLGLGRRVLLPRVELGRDEHLVARDPALAQPLADAVLVPVRLGRVEVPIAQLERPANRVDALRPIRDLPHAEPEQRDPVAVCELASGAIHGTRR